MSHLISTTLLLIFLLFCSTFFLSNAHNLKKFLKKRKCLKCTPNNTSTTSFISIPLTKNFRDLKTKKKYFDFLSESHSYLISKKIDSLLETKTEKRVRKSHTTDKKSISLYNFKNTQVNYFLLLFLLYFLLSTLVK